MHSHYLKQKGEIIGDLSQVQPFIYLFHGGNLRKSRGAHSKEIRGIFDVHEEWKDGIFLKNGMLLPLYSCRDEAIRTTLIHLGDILPTECIVDGAAERRQQAQNILDLCFNGDIRIADDATMAGFVEFERSRPFFQMLNHHFSYIEEFFDNPEGEAEPTILKPFPFVSYGDYLEWYYEQSPRQYMSWTDCVPSLVFKGVGYLGDFFTYRKFLNRKTFGLDQFFQLKSGIAPQEVSVLFDMTEGAIDIYMTLHVGQHSQKIFLSSTWPPIELMIEWLKAAQQGDLPVAFHIDEERTDKYLALYPTDQSDLAFFRLTSPYHDEKDDLFIEAIINRHQMIEVFRTALKEFFMNDFRARDWHYSDEYLAEGHMGERILNDPWLVT